MSKDFIKLEDRRKGGSIIVNINNIAFWDESNTIVVCGIHGDGNSLIQITFESGERLLKMIESRLWSEVDV